MVAGLGRSQKAKHGLGLGEGAPEGFKVSRVLLPLLLWWWWWRVATALLPQPPLLQPLVVAPLLPPPRCCCWRCCHVCPMLLHDAPVHPLLPSQALVASCLRLNHRERPSFEALLTQLDALLAQEGGWARAHGGSAGAMQLGAPAPAAC